MPRVTEKKHIDIDHSCVSNPVYLNWQGTNGGRNYWLFKTVQTRGLNVTVEGTFEVYQTDIENAQGDVQDLERTARPRLTIGAKVPISKLLGLEKVLYSINVLMLMNPGTWETAGPGGTPKPIWQIVRVVPGTFKLNDTDEKFHTLELTIELPAINIQAV